MTNPNTVTLKMVAALLEAIDVDDAKDAERAVATIKALLEAAAGK
jgi:hypothetical protein